MTRFQPLLAAAPARPHKLRSALAGAGLIERRAQAGEADELRLFLTAWLGGLVFFGTFLA